MQAPAVSGSWLEGRKMFFETMKHLATLSTGAVVVLATLAKDTFPAAKPPYLFGLVLFFLTCSAGLSVPVMIKVSSVVSNPSDHAESRAVGVLFLLALAAFVLGLLGLVVFVSLNL